MGMLELKLEWLLLSRMYYRSHNLYFDKWLVGLDLTEKEFQNNVIPLLMQLAQSSKGGYELLEETLELTGEQEWKG